MHAFLFLVVDDELIFKSPTLTCLGSDICMAVTFDSGHCCGVVYTLFALHIF